MTSWYCASTLLNSRSLVRADGTVLRSSRRATVDFFWDTADVAREVMVWFTVASSHQVTRRKGPGTCGLHRPFTVRLPYVCLPFTLASL